MRKLVLGAVSAVLLLAIAGVAYAATQQKFSESYTSNRPSKSVGLKFFIEGTDPANPENQRPKPSNSIDIFFASGTVFNNKGARQCKATDSDFASKGEKACPSGSKIDNGVASQNAAVAKLKSGNPINVKVSAFNRKGGIILYLRPSVGSPFALRPTLKGKPGSQHLLTTIPKITIPNDEIILTKLTLATKPKNIGKTVLVKSPPKAKCPAKTHKWTFKAKWNYRDGTKETKTSTQKCRR